MINNAAAGGPKEDRGSTPDQNLDGALCLRSLATAKDAVTGAALSGTPRAQARRIAEGVEEIRATGKLRRVPAVIVTGRNDGILPPNFTSRAYFGLNNVVDGSTSTLRYYEVTNAQHLDTFNEFPGYNDKYIPLHRYFNQAMDLMYDHLRQRRAVAAEPGGAHDAARARRSADHRGQRAADCRLAAARRADHLQRRAAADTGLSGRGAPAHIPQFHIGPIGVLVQHGPKPPAFQRPR